MAFRFKKFRVYEEAKRFCKLCRDITQRDIKPQYKELASQIERALISIVLNIAEGSADSSDLEFRRFLGISIRSAYELVAAFDLAMLHGMIRADDFAKIESEAEELVNQLSAFRNSLQP